MVDSPLGIVFVSTWNKERKHKALTRIIYQSLHTLISIRKNRIDTLMPTILWEMLLSIFEIYVQNKYTVTEFYLLRYMHFNTAESSDWQEHRLTLKLYTRQSPEGTMVSRVEDLGLTLFFMGRRWQKTMQYFRKTLLVPQLVCS